METAHGARRPCVVLLEPDRASSLLFSKFFETVGRRASPYRARPKLAVAAAPGDSHLGAFLVRARDVDEERAACTNADGVSRSWLQSGAVRLGVASGVEASIDRVSASQAAMPMCRRIGYGGNDCRSCSGNSEVDAL